MLMRCGTPAPPGACAPRLLERAAKSRGPPAPPRALAHTHIQRRGAGPGSPSAPGGEVRGTGDEGRGMGGAGRRRIVSPTWWCGPMTPAEDMNTCRRHEEGARRVFIAHQVFGRNTCQAAAQPRPRCTDVTGERGSRKTEGSKSTSCPHYSHCRRSCRITHNCSSSRPKLCICLHNCVGVRGLTWLLLA